MSQIIHIFRPGRHTAMQGTTIDFGESDLIATANAGTPRGPAGHRASPGRRPGLGLGG